MDLIDKYLDGVRPLLPGDQRDDILEELDGVLRRRMEEKAAELGRRLTRREEEAVLSAYGHPIMVAARYGPQQTLIGPEFFPLWWLGARAVVVIDIVAHIAQAMSVLVDGSQAGHVAERLMALWGGFFSFGFALIGALTISIAVVERFKLQPFGTWKPDNNPFRKIGKAPSRVESGAAIVGALFGIAFWIALPWIQSWGPFLFGRVIIAPISTMQMVGVALGPIWFPTLWTMILVGSLISVSANFADLIDPADRARPALIRMFAALMGVAIGLTALLAGPLFVITGPTSRALDRLLELSQWLTIGIAVATLAHFIAAVWYGWRFLRLRREQAARPAQSNGAATG
jgi:hypothetical protein